MRIAILKHSRSAVVAAGLAIAGALTGSAEASVLVASPSLPLIDIPYISPTGAGCFTIASVCVTPGAFVQTSATSSLVGPNEEIVAEATYSATLTPPGGSTIVGSVALTGTVDETVLGRMSLTETGTFTTDITGLDLTGALSLPGSPFDGHALEVTISAPSSGTTTIAPDGGAFRIASFFDVFIDISLPGTGLSTSVGPINLVAVPEPSTWAMLLIGFAGLGSAAYRRRATSTA